MTSIASDRRLWRSLLVSNHIEAVGERSHSIGAAMHYSLGVNLNEMPQLAQIYLDMHVISKLLTPCQGS